MDFAKGGPWFVLVSFSLHAFCNQFLYLNFASVSEITEAAFHIDDLGTNWLYTTSMLSAIPSFIFVMVFSEANHWAVSFTGILATVLAGWLRYLAVAQKSYTIAMLSSAALGPGTGVILVGFAELPVLLFPQGGWSRKLCTGIAVQMTWFGWANGSLLTPYVVKTASGLTSFCLVQAICVSICLPVFLAFHRHSAESEREEASNYGAVDNAPIQDSHRGHLSIKESVQLMFSNRRYVLVALATAMIQAVGFAVPAVQEEVFSNKGYNGIACAWNGFVFIMAGVAAGMLLACSIPNADDSKSTQLIPRLVLASVWIGTISMFTLQFSVHFYGGMLGGLGEVSTRVFLYSLLGIAGACSLGFVNITVPFVCSEAHPVSETYSGGTTEMLGFGLGAVLTQASTGQQFWVCAAASLAAAVLMTVGMWCPPESTETDQLELEPDSAARG